MQVWEGVGSVTAIFNAIRSLDARLDRGEITPEQYARRRAALLQNVEDASSDFIDITPAEPAVEPAAPDTLPRAAKTGSSAFGLGLVVVLGVMGLCIALTLLFLPNMNLALTLGVTILAALCVALMHEKEEETE
jgi:hypothetical protein